METPLVPVNATSKTDWSFEEYNKQQPEITSSDVVDAAYELAWRDTGLGLMARKSIISEFAEQNKTKITAEQANTLYPNMRVPFREDVNPLIARLKADDEAERDKLIQKINNGPNDGWTKTKIFGAGLVAHLMDPIEFGAGAFVGWGVGGLAARGAFGAKIAATSAAVEAGSAGAATRIGFNFAREATGNLVQNVGQEFAQGAVEGMENVRSERTGSDILTDIAIGTFASSIVSTGVAEGAYQLKGIKRIFRNTSPEADIAYARAVVSAIETETKPDVNPLIEVLAKETSVLPQDFGKPAYNFDPVTPENIKSKKFFVATRDNTKDLVSADRAALGDDFGFGTHITDNPGVANAAAARSMADNVGAVHSVEVGDLKPLNLDSVLPDGLTKNEVLKILKEVQIGEEDIAINTQSAKSLFEVVKYAEDADLIPEGTLASLKESIQADGFNSMVSDGKTHLGYEHQAHNHITVLDDNLLKPIESFEPDKTMVNAPSKEIIKSTTDRNTDPGSKLFADTEQYQANLEQIKDIQVQTKNDFAGIRKQSEDVISEFEDMLKQGLIKESDLESIKMGIQDIEDQHIALKAFAACVRG